MHAWPAAFIKGGGVKVTRWGGGRAERNAREATDGVTRAGVGRKESNSARLSRAQVEMDPWRTLVVEEVGRRGEEEDSAGDAPTRLLAREGEATRNGRTGDKSARAWVGAREKGANVRPVSGWDRGAGR